jgi:hypothetical protein
MFEKGVLGRSFVPKRDEKIGGHKKLYTKEGGDLYFSPNVNRISNSRDVRACSMQGKDGNCTHLWYGNVGRPRRSRRM